MGRAGDQSAGGQAVPGEDAAPEWAAIVTRELQLTALRWAWAEAYQVTAGADGLEAYRLDGLGGVHASSPDVLRRAIMDDYARTPVCPP
jgi:hypothetical protein